VQTTAADPLVGRALEGRYRILERIARGGMSTVYAAVDERLDRLVAVKVMSAALSADPAFSDRFSREARAAARLTHLNAVSVYDQGHEVGADGHHVFLVMELVEGRTLRELLRERGRLSAAEAVSIMEPVLSALSAAHRAGLVHRDVKPENILLSDEGVVKVADFGLARAVESDIASTRTGLMMGTVAYCSPEQIARGSADPRSDVYSAGIVLFELLTGEPPYRGDSAMNVAYQHVHSRVPAPSSRLRPHGGIPSEIDELVIDATDSDPASRPADAGAFLAEIADVRAALALPVTPVPRRQRTGNAAQRGPRHTPPVRHRTPDAVTTGEVRAQAGQHDTAIDPSWAAPGTQQRPARGAAPWAPGPRAESAGSRPGLAPPPVLPPGRPEAHRRSRKSRRRRTLLVLLIVALLGAGAAYGAWYLAAGRYSRVPGVRGASEQSALHKLKAAGYRVSVSPGPRFDDGVARGLALTTSPPSHTRAVRGTRIVMVISAGPHYYQVRNVTGQDPTQARASLEAEGRVSVADRIRPEASDTVPTGKVTRTDPKAGTQVTARQPVTIFVSTGPPMVAVPNIAQGIPVSTARSALKKAHLKWQIVEQYSDGVAKDRVISASPTGSAPKFSTVTLTVSRGPEMVRVPDIGTGESVADARKAITAVGLRVQVRPFLGETGTPTTVLGVSPHSGASVRAGSTVVVYAISG
jgi:eukaryotic-like serine/threonine-protein kinase